MSHPGSNNQPQCLHSSGSSRSTSNVHNPPLSIKNHKSCSNSYNHFDTSFINDTNQLPSLNLDSQNSPPVFSKFWQDCQNPDGQKPSHSQKSSHYQSAYNFPKNINVAYSQNQSIGIQNSLPHFKNPPYLKNPSSNLNNMTSYFQNKQCITESSSSIQYNLKFLPPNMSSIPPNLQVPPPNQRSLPSNLQSLPPNLLCQPPNLQRLPPNILCKPPNLQSMPPNILHKPHNLQSMPPNILCKPPDLKTLPPNFQNFVNSPRIVHPNSLPLLPHIVDNSGHVNFHPNGDMHGQHSHGKAGSNFTNKEKAIESVMHPLSDGKTVSYKKQQSIVSEWIQSNILIESDENSNKQEDIEHLLIKLKSSNVAKLHQVHCLIGLFQDSIETLDADLHEESKGKFLIQLEEISSLFDQSDFQEKVRRAVVLRRRKRNRQRKAKKKQKDHFLAVSEEIDKKIKQENDIYKSEIAEIQLKSQVRLASINVELYTDL